MKAKWCIQGFDGVEEIYKCEIPHHYFSGNQVKEVLKRLASRYLTEDEIISSSLNRHAKSKPQFLSIQGEGGKLMCGSNPYFTATYTKCKTGRN